MMSDLEQRILVTEQAFRVFAQTESITVSCDGRVSEKNAERLLCYAPRYLKNLRMGGKAPPHYHQGMGGCRVSYRLRDLARWVEEKREDF